MTTGGLVTTDTAIVPMHWSPPAGEPVQWDYALQETLDSIKRGIAEAARGEGRYLSADDLAPDDDE